MEKEKNKSGINWWKVGTGVFGGLTIIYTGLFAMAITIVVSHGISTDAIMQLGTGITNEEISQEAEENNLALDDKGKKLLKYMKAYYADDIDYDKVRESMYTGLVDGLEDDYSYYMTKEQYDALKTDNTGEFAGIGIKMQTDYSKGYTKVIKVYTDGPADKAGMKEGDLLYKVDGESVSAWTSDELVNHVRGEKGTDITVTVYRDSKEIDLTMTRDTVTVEEVTSERINKDTGYIKLNEFNGKAAEQMQEVAKEFKASGIENIILDLRDNPGGSVQVLEDFSNIFFDKGIIAEIKGKSEITSETVQSNGRDYNFNVICLVNENSASASEMFSGAMNELNDTILIGKKTYGKGIAQMVTGLDDGSAIKLTIGKYYLPDGDCIHKVGIEPTIEMEQEEDVENIKDDVLVQKAISLFEDGVYTVSDLKEVK